MPYVAHAPTPLIFLINIFFFFFLLWPKLFDQLQSLAISVAYLIVKRNHESCLPLMLHKRLYYSMENISIFKVTACLFLSTSPSWAVLAAQLLDRNQWCACIFLCSAPWVSVGDINFAVLVPDHHLCEHEHCLHSCWNSPLLQGLFKNYLYLYLLLVVKGGPDPIYL